MKMLKIFLIITLIVISFQRTDKKFKTTASSSSKSVGNTYKVWIYRDGLSTSPVATGTLRVDKINNDNTVGHVGLPFDNVSEINAEKFSDVAYLFQAEKTYVLEYKRFLENCPVYAYNPTGSGMYFYFNFISPKDGKTYTYYVLFEYSVFSSVIEFDTDLNNTLRNKVMNVCKAQKDKIKSKKTQCSSEGSIYTTNKPLYEKDQAGSLDYAAQIKTQQGLVTTKTAERTKLQTTSTSTQASITTKNSEIETLRKKKNTSESSANQNSSAIIKGNSDQENLKSQKTAGKADASKFQENVDASQQVLTDAFKWFVDQGDDFNQEEIKAAQDAILTKKSYNDFLPAWNKILPCAI